MKKKQQIEVSLFAFQDIITATTGIIILFIIALALLIKPTTTTKSAELHADTNEILKQQLQDLKLQYREVNSKLATINSAIARNNLSPEEYQAMVDKQEKLLKLQRQNLVQINSQIDKIKQQMGIVISDINSDPRSVEELNDEINRIQDELQQLQSSDTDDKFQRQKNSLIAKITQLKKELTTNRGNPKDVSYQFEGEDDSKVTIIALYSSSVVIIDLATRNRTVLKGSATRNQAKIMLTIRQMSQDHKLFIAIAPAAFSGFMAIKRDIRISGIRWGYDLLASDDSVVR